VLNIEMIDWFVLLQCPDVTDSRAFIKDLSTLNQAFTAFFNVSKIKLIN